MMRLVVAAALAAALSAILVDGMVPGGGKPGGGKPGGGKPGGGKPGDGKPWGGKPGDGKPWGDDPHSLPIWMYPLLKSQQGQDGRDGEKGKTGWPGIEGDTGPVGPPGDQKGAKGDMGQKGDMGGDGEAGGSGPLGGPGTTGGVGTDGLDNFDGGVVYIAWGLDSCPVRATAPDVMLSSGWASSPYFGETGGGANYMCLLDNPIFASEADAVETPPRSDVVGVEFSTTGEPLGAFHGMAVACSHCFAPYSTQLMIPGSATCPLGWTMAYNGYLMSAGDQDSATLTAARDEEHYRTEYICVAATPFAAPPITPVNNRESLLYHVHLDCQANSINCNPNPFGQITCAVCLRSLAT